jgi:hypothetical protein
MHELPGGLTDPGCQAWRGSAGEEGREGVYALRWKAIEWQYL